MARHSRPTPANFARWLTKREESMLAGHLRGALKAPDLARHLGPKERARSWALRATACRRQRDREGAVDAWARALRLSPEDGWILPRFAVWHLDQGRFADGLATAIRGLELAYPKDQPDAYYARGQALWMCGHPREALSDFATAARRAPLNSPTQLCAVVSIAAALAHSALATPEAAAVVLELAADLRPTLGTRKFPRIRALLRWSTGLAQCARGRKMAGGRELFRARQAFLALGDAATAAAVTLDYATVTGRPVEPLLSEVLDNAPVDTEEQTLAILAGLASGRSGGSQRNQLTSLALSLTIRRRSEA